MLSLGALGAIVALHRIEDLANASTASSTSENWSGATLAGIGAAVVVLGLLAIAGLLTVPLVTTVLVFLRRRLPRVAMSMALCGIGLVLTILVLLHWGNQGRAVLCCAEAVVALGIVGTTLSMVRGVPETGKVGGVLATMGLMLLGAALLWLTL